MREEVREKFFFYLSLDRSFLVSKKKIGGGGIAPGSYSDFYKLSLSLSLFMKNNNNTQAKPANAAMLQLIVGFLVGAVFVSIFSGSGSNYSVRSSFSLSLSLSLRRARGTFFFCLFVCVCSLALSLFFREGF